MLERLRPYSGKHNPSITIAQLDTTGLSMLLKKLPIRLLEAAIVAAFFVFVVVAKLYFWLLHKTERIRWRVMLTMPTRRDKSR